MAKHLMTLGGIIFSVIFAVMFFSAILFVIFGQVTVRKLRKNPATKHELGIEFLSGWDIFNVATVLALPKWYAQKMKVRSTTGWLHANVDLLYEHTTAFDRVLAGAFYWSWMSSAFGLLIFGALDWLELFD